MTHVPVMRVMRPGHGPSPPIMDPFSYVPPACFFEGGISESSGGCLAGTKATPLHISCLEVTSCVMEDRGEAIMLQNPPIILFCSAKQ